MLGLAHGALKKYGMLHEFACHPCTGAMLIFFCIVPIFSICAAKVSTLFYFIIIIFCFGTFLL